MVHNDELAKRRHDRNVFSRTNKPITSEAEQLGIAGELAFANLLGIDHTPASVAPTKGYQFNLGPTAHIKISTSRTPGNLFVKEGKVRADVYVLAGCEGEPVMENVYFVGWTHAGEVKKAEAVTPTHSGGYIQPAHRIPRQDLMDMKYLLHALDHNPDHLNRFPLSRFGHYVVQETRRRDHPNTPMKQMDMINPLPIKKPKAGS